MTNHKVYFHNANSMEELNDNSINLVITSPPYPMIEMWDEIMANQNEKIAKALHTRPYDAFEFMHQELDKIWEECYRVLKDGAFLCINIGDATRTINEEFKLYNNHARIIQSCEKIGFTNLPNIIWRKPTNAPNKFMGSGMLPSGAYVTLEHEWILIFRKNKKRNYKTEEDKKSRRESAFFWEERNKWFSDLWEFIGTKQKIVNTQSRERNASYPLLLPYRIINMYSQIGDTVLDPFMGLGTTMHAAILTERNCIGYEIDKNLSSHINSNIESLDINKMNNIIKSRIDEHKDFINKRISEGKPIKYQNDYLNCPVMTRQETEIALHYIETIQSNSEQNGTLNYECKYQENSSFDQLPYINSTLSLF